MSNVKAKKKPKNTKCSKVALVYAQGTIVDSGGDDDVAADKIAPILLGLAEDDDYQGVVLRIDSPGGSPGASETILHAVQKIQEEGKFVTVSMGRAAASGGYWIASSADQIFALPTTMTGSIGVLGGKFSLKQLWAKLGIHWEDVSWGDKASMWSMNEPYNKAQAERMNAMMDNIYDNFVARVAKGRGLAEKDVEKIARGRVWSGQRAAEIGLVDQIGGLNEALDYAAQQVGANDRHGVVVDIFPRSRTPVEELIDLLETQVSAGEALQIQAGLLRSVLPRLGEALAEQNLLFAHPAVVYEPVRVLAQ